jgi:DtxR family Mn-dependent transcriptional regulator
MGRIARSLDVVPGTATTMVKSLSVSGLFDYEPRKGVRLTSAGKELAIHVLRRHRLIELFLVKTLGLDWSQIHLEAERLEHAISDTVLDRIDQLLGHPVVDPHGDPIPTANGSLDEGPATTLMDCAIDASVRIARIADQDPEFLQFVENSGLKPGVRLRVNQRNRAANAVTLTPHAKDALTLGQTAAEKIFVY